MVSPYDHYHSTHFIRSGGVDTAVQVDIRVSDIKSTFISPKTVHCGLKNLAYSFTSSEILLQTWGYPDEAILKFSLKLFSDPLIAI